MTIQDYIDEIRLKLTGGVLELEIDDDTIEKIIKSSLRELQRYISTTTLIQVPFNSCVDLSNYQIYHVVNVHRVDGLLAQTSSNQEGISTNDPLLMSQWQMIGGYGNMASLSDWASNYEAWSSMQQIRNTLSTDLSHYYDATNKKLYINVALDKPTDITIEYIPKFDSVDEITSEYWEDVLLRLSLAQVKVLLGRIRTKYKLNSSVWSLDGDTILNEGTTELNELREKLISNNRLSFLCD